MQRFVCIHGHFYQPPRENPWLETIEVQDSAYPYHDWNERVTAECYAPNADSRILVDESLIERIVNNYKRISFNFGPTLLAWLEIHDPTTYAAILAADREAAERFSGHGSAMAQVYNHAILPLANERDKRTQVVWGIRDFEHRFGRKPEGIWLPETAADTASLEMLASHGIQFTVLAPGQAARVRPIGTEEWTEVDENSLNTGVPYRVDLPGGASIAVFFYHGSVSRAVAFEQLLASGEKFASRLLGQFPSELDDPRLISIATDGETYGHHHRFGNMALAFALQSIESDETASLTNYGEFLELHPPQFEAQIVENSSWSCSHGVERWRDACGCTSGRHPGWHQRWRKPLREALDWLRDELAPRFEQEGRNFFTEPWRARDDYIAVILDRSNETIDLFLQRVGHRKLEGADRVRALKLLESQRQAQLMYTSCAWFFEEVSGIETMQNLQYAARAIQLGEELFDVSLEQPFLERLAEAPSNVPEYGNGRGVYERRVGPAKVELPRIAANAAASLLFEEGGTPDLVRGFEIEAEECSLYESGRARLMLGRLAVVSRVTREHGDFDFAFLHLGDHNLSGAVRPRSDDTEFRTMSAELSAAFEAGDIPGVIRSLEQRFHGSADSLRTLFRDEQRRILDRILESTELEAEDVHRRLYRQHAPLMRFITSLETQSPRALQAAAELVLNVGLRRELESPELDPLRLQPLIDEAQSVGVALDGAGLGYAARAALERLMARLDEEPEDRSLLETVARAAKLFSELPFEVDLRRVENGYFRLLQTVAPEIRERAETGEEPARRWVEAFEELGDTLRFARIDAEVLNARRLLVLLLVFVAFSLCAWGCESWWPRVVDDAYITFHYAQNLVDGLGPVYNAGERVEGYSSPSWMFLSAAIIATGFDPVAASKWIGLLVTLALVSWVYAAARRREVTDVGAALAALLLGSSMVLQIWSVSGMETNLYALLFFGGLLALGERPMTTRNTLTSSSLLVAAGLTRPEGLAFWCIGLIVVFAAGIGRQERLRHSMLYALPGLALLLHFVWRLLYYGSWLPNTYYTKTGGGLRMWQQGLHGLWIFLAHPAHWIWIAAAVAGTAVGLARPGRRLKVGILAGAVLLHLAYIVSVGDDGLRVHRFYVPILAPLALLVAELFAREGSGRFARPRLALAGVVAVLATSTFSVRSLHADLLPGALPGMVRYQEGNAKLGRQLARSLPPDTLIAVAAAGALPYYSRLPAIDMYGLNDARIAHRPFPPIRRGRLMKWDNEYVLSRGPRLIVINRGYFEQGDPRAEELARNPASLAVSPMDRDLFRRVAQDGSYALNPVVLEDGSVFFVFERRTDADGGGSCIIRGSSTGSASPRAWHAGWRSVRRSTPAATGSPSVP